MNSSTTQLWIVTRPIAVAAIAAIATGCSTLAPTQLVQNDTPVVSGTAHAPIRHLDHTHPAQTGTRADGVRR